MVEWVASAVDSIEGFNQFMGSVAYPLVWIVGGIFVVFVVIAIARRLFGVAF